MAAAERKSRQQLQEEATARRIKEVVAKAPPLTPRQQTRLAVIFEVRVDAIQDELGTQH